MGKEIVRWADDAMYEAQPIKREEGARVYPRVFLLNATPDPLGTLAADMRMYRGDPVYSLDEITDEQRRWAWDELSKTKLNTPLEGVTLKFMIEAVTRSFTHQMVRQRVGAYYVQESLRFAVKRGLAQEVALPPSIIDHSNTEPSQHAPDGVMPWRIWTDAIQHIDEAYNLLVDAGIPAEDARGLLPHAVTTRIIYNTNLRALFDVAGSRLCTQAQFEWRAVFMGMMKAMRKYNNGLYRMRGPVSYSDISKDQLDDAWQWDIIAAPAPMTFAPACYHAGRCTFMASLDRGCTIRPRVEAFAARGIPSSQWGFGEVDDGLDPSQDIPPISPEEWMANPLAGTTSEYNPRPE